MARRAQARVRARLLAQFVFILALALAGCVRHNLRDALRVGRGISVVFSYTWERRGVCVVEDGAPPSGS